MINCLTSTYARVFRSIVMRGSGFPLVLVRIRLYQIRRHIAGLGPFSSSALLLATCLTGYYLTLQYHSFSHGLVCSSVILGTILFVQTQRPDNGFVFHSIERPSLNLFVEYTLFSFPFSGPALMTGTWYFFPVIVLGSLVISQLHAGKTERTTLPHLSKILPPEHFEWLGGVRKNAILISMILALALALCWARFLPLLVLWILTGVVVSFYQECEPLHILIATSSGSGSKFLRSKMIRHSKLLLMCFFPVLLINALVHPDLVWFSAIFAALQLSVLWLAILLKYSRYEPGRHLPGNSIPVLLAFVSTILPFLLPVSLLMSMRYFRSGVNNLRLSVHD